MKVEPVTFTLGDDPQVYTLIRDINAVCDVEAKTGLNLSVFAFSAGLTASQERALLFAYLLKAHPKVLLSEAGDLLSRDEDKVLEALGKAMKVGVPTKEPPAEVPAVTNANMEA